MKICRSTSSLLKFYNLCGVLLEKVEHANYLGITISNNLEWGNHVDVTARKASNTLNSLKRNLKYCSKQAKQTAYISLVRSVMEYRGTIWDPHFQKYKDKLEKVNRRSSVIAILEKLEWQSLKTPSPKPAFCPVLSTTYSGSAVVTSRPSRSAYQGTSRLQVQDYYH